MTDKIWPSGDAAPIPALPNPNALDEQDYIAATFERLKAAVSDYTHHVEALRVVRSRLTFQRRYLELLAEAIRLEGGSCELPPMHPTRSRL